MIELQQTLDDRYRTLGESRSGPVFFIEHGMTEDEVDNLIAVLGKEIEVHPVESSWWRLYPLPLIVVATEIGYNYRGTGTDFWPVLESKIGAHISPAERRRIRDLFASASKAYRGAQPPATRWAAAFPFIAWPITHALVPTEFHRPLALTLANLRVNIGELTDDELHRAIQIIASNSSARFLTLLEDAALVTVVTRSLLGTGSAELCRETALRIEADLDADRIARRGVAAARHLQRTSRGSTAPQKSSRVSLPSIPGSLQLRRREDAISLEAFFPPAEPNLQLRLRRALRRRRYAARLWGVSAPVPSEQLLSGLPFSVKLATAPPEDAELLPGLQTIEIDQDLRDVLASFSLDFALPSLFAVAADREIGRRVRGPKITGHRAYWLLSGSIDGLKDCPLVGKVGPYGCYFLDPSEEAVRELLSGLGFEVRFGIAVDFVGAPPLDPDATAPAFVVGDKRIVVPRSTSPEGLSVQLGEEQVRLSGDTVASAFVELGDHTLQLSYKDESRSFAFRGLPLYPKARPQVASIETRSDDLSIHALLRGTLGFAVESFAPLEGLDLTVEIQAGGRRVHATAPLRSLPSALYSDQEPFVTLLNDDVRELLMRTDSLTLQLSIGNLCSCTVVLERRVRPCWWHFGPDHRYRLTSEMGDLSFGAVSVLRPHLPPEESLPTQDSRAILFVPLAPDLHEFGGAAPFTTFCTAPPEFDLQGLILDQPKLVRSLRGQSGAAGLEDLAEAYLRWSLAECDNIIAESYRKQVTYELDEWIVEICCGPHWRNLEQSTRHVDPWKCLVDLAVSSRLGRDAYVDLPDSIWLQSLDIATEQLRREMPNLWDLIRPPYVLDKQEWQVVEAAFEYAFRSLRDDYNKLGELEVSEKLGEADFTADNSPDNWQPLLESITAEHHYHALASLLLPTDAALELAFALTSDFSFDELCDEFIRWAHKNNNSLIFKSTDNENAFRGALALWADPEFAVCLEWREALRILLSDRAVARAARYLALRYRLLREEA